MRWILLLGVFLTAGDDHELHLTAYHIQKFWAVQFIVQYMTMELLVIFK